MALTAGERSMASGQQIAGSPVIKILLRGIPSYQFEIAPVVFLVAGIARLCPRSRTDQLRMQTAPALKALLDLPMACQTLPAGQLCSDLVTVDAVLCVIKRAVSPGQGSGGNLRQRGGASRIPECDRENELFARRGHAFDCETIYPHLGASLHSLPGDASPQTADVEVREASYRRAPDSPICFWQICGCFPRVS